MIKLSVWKRSLWWGKGWKFGSFFIGLCRMFFRCTIDASVGCLFLSLSPRHCRDPFFKQPTFLPYTHGDTRTHTPCALPHCSGTWGWRYSTRPNPQTNTYRKSPNTPLVPPIKDKTLLSGNFINIYITHMYNYHQLILIIRFTNYKHNTKNCN